MTGAAAPTAVTTLQDQASKEQAVRRDRTRLWATALQVNAEARDFTVNALYYDPFNRLLLDYVGGAHDCKLRRLRTVAEPNASFAEDPCRLLRAVRHAARTGAGSAACGPHLAAVLYCGRPHA